MLIPNHVRSPRRAKTLLNSFALAYDLGNRRMMAGHIADDLPARGRELAFLTCLRVEFPLLAAELQQHPELISALRAEIGLADASDLRHSDDVTVLAQQFLAGRRPTDQMLASDQTGVAMPDSDLSVSAEPDAADDDEAFEQRADRRLRLSTLEPANSSSILERPLVSPYLDKT